MTKTDAWRFEPAELDAVLSGKGLNAMLGHCYHAHGDRWIELAMPWQERLTGDPQERSLARGPVMALLDNTAGVSIWLRRGGYLPQVTLDLRTDYLRPLERGAGLICRCECVSLSSSIGYARGIAYERSPDDPACLVSSAYALL
ncbi:PaaI family thioesterase [Novosphingobium album (ex Hu et al. 2023)]|uniref:PaaI family thioesterase n=1 Tax=Novosphingobium album (ex Hu et al. 2023) TaxID=2930093 RepID=A0ABT0B7Q7_9SPHN|nr:PaaI family thioesterase [Novosphingobium album (ex Hu et al. 2023)]MCJ2181052.1 PaaI family thioesterase [Novosphingobium album (ex Hu et al. 2023)]